VWEFRRSDEGEWRFTERVFGRFARPETKKILIMRKGFIISALIAIAIGVLLSVFVS
jgi:hypothetical protein